MPAPGDEVARNLKKMTRRGKPMPSRSIFFLEAGRAIAFVTRCCIGYMVGTVGDVPGSRGCTGAAPGSATGRPHPAAGAEAER